MTNIFRMPKPCLYVLLLREEEGDEDGDRPGLDDLPGLHARPGRNVRQSPRSLELGQNNVSQNPHAASN